MQHCIMVIDDTLSPAWIAYLNMAILLGTLALALFNASEDHIARNFAYVYAVISIGVLVSLIYNFSTPLVSGTNSSLALIGVWLGSLSEAYNDDP